MLVRTDQEAVMNVVELLNDLLGREPTRQLRLQLAEVYDNASRRRPADAIGSRKAASESV
jgi:hypothetical protein